MGRTGLGDDGPERVAAVVLGLLGAQVRLHGGERQQRHQEGAPLLRRQRQLRLRRGEGVQRARSVRVRVVGVGGLGGGDCGGE